MWTKAKQREFDRLRDKELAEGLSESEQSVLNGFYRELDDEESARLAPALARYEEQHVHNQAEIARLREKVATLKQIEQQYRDLYTRIRRDVDKYLRERDDLRRAAEEVSLK